MGNSSSSPSASSAKPPATQLLPLRAYPLESTEDSANPFKQTAAPPSATTTTKEIPTSQRGNYAPRTNNATNPAQMHPMQSKLAANTKGRANAVTDKNQKPTLTKAVANPLHTNSKPNGGHRSLGGKAPSPSSSSTKTAPQEGLERRGATATRSPLPPSVSNHHVASDFGPLTFVDSPDISSSMESWFSGCPKASSYETSDFTLNSETESGTEGGNDLLSQHLHGRQPPKSNPSSWRHSSAQPLKSMAVRSIDEECRLCNSPDVMYACTDCEEDCFLCERCRFADEALAALHDRRHRIVQLHGGSPSGNSTSGNSTSALSDATPQISLTLSSTYFTNPCTLCSRPIEDGTTAFRCETCDFIVCDTCHINSQPHEVEHSHPLRQFQRRRSLVQESGVIRKRTLNGNMIINNYAVVGVIGQGSYGQVKLVQHVATHLPYALKVLRKQKGGTTGQVVLGTRPRVHQEDHLREIAVMKCVEHENIVRLHEVIDDTERGRIYLIMEFCRGGPVHVWGNPPLPVAKVCRYGRHILHGLLHLHSEFLYHRDVKPANCLVDSHDVCKLADFGACNSRILSSSFEGTPAFSCPELVGGIDVSGEVVDSWAYAITMCQMAFGALPCDSMTPFEYREVLRSKEPLPFTPLQQTPPPPADSPGTKSLLHAAEYVPQHHRGRRLRSLRSRTVAECHPSEEAVPPETSPRSPDSRSPTPPVGERATGVNTAKQEEDEGVDLLKDLLRQMLAKDLRQRLLLRGAQHHRFFTTDSGEIPACPSMTSPPTAAHPDQRNTPASPLEQGPTKHAQSDAHSPSQVGNKTAALYERGLAEVKMGLNVAENFHGLRYVMRDHRREATAFESLRNASYMERRWFGCDQTLSSNVNDSSDLVRVGSESAGNLAATSPEHASHQQQRLADVASHMGKVVDANGEQPPLSGSSLKLDGCARPPTILATTPIASPTSRPGVVVVAPDEKPLDLSPKGSGDGTTDVGEVKGSENLTEEQKCAAAAQVIAGLVQAHLEGNRTTLELRGQRMKIPPESLHDLQSRTRRILMTCNGLTTLAPVRWSAFSPLTTLDVTYNNLTQFPQEVLTIPRLLSLNLTSNYIKEIPTTLSEAKYLQRLNLSGNLISRVGVHPVTQESLLATPSLLEVQLAGNLLRHLPEALRTTERLTLSLDAVPTMMSEWTAEVASSDAPHPVTIHWDDKFPKLFYLTSKDGEPITVWLAFEPLSAYSTQTLTVSGVRYVVVSRAIDRRLPYGCFTGGQLLAHMKGGERKCRRLWPNLFNPEACSCVHAFFFVDDNVESPNAGFHALVRFLEEHLHADSPILFVCPRGQKEMPLSPLCYSLHQLTGIPLKELLQQAQTVMQSVYA